MSSADIQETRVLAHGVDGLEVSCAVRQAQPLMRKDVHPGVGEDGNPLSLCLLERELLSRGRNLGPGRDTGWRWSSGGGDHVVKAVPPPRPGYKHALETDDWLIMIAHPGALRPRFAIQVRSAFLWEVGPINAYRKIRDWIETELLWRVNGVPPEESPCWRISRLDLAADICGIDLTPASLPLFVTRARDREEYHLSVAAKGHHKGRAFTGFTFGARSSPVYARIYDKTRQSDSSDPIRRVWRDGGFEPGESQAVWRVEFEPKREVLRDLQAPDGKSIPADPEGTLEAADAIWAYCVTKWLTYRTKEEHTEIARRPMDAWWRQLAGLEGFVGESGTPTTLVRRLAKPPKPSNQLARALTSLVGYSASTGTEDFSQAVAALIAHANERGGDRDFTARVKKRTS